MTPFRLRDYQANALDAITQNFARGTNKQVAVLATGLGKTIIFSHLISNIIGNSKKKALVLAHREELLYQAKEKLEKINPSLHIGIEQAENAADHSHDNVILASTATLGKENSTRLAAFYADDYRIIIIDEAHHASAQSYKTILRHFGVLKNTPYDWNKNLLLLGVTATPNRNDNQGIDMVFDDVTFSYGIVPGIRQGWLSRIKAIKITTATDISGVKETGYDFNSIDLSKKINNQKRNTLILNTYLDLANGKQTLIFASDVTHTTMLFEKFKAAGIKAGYVIGSMNKRDRAKQLEKFSRKEINVMINAMVLTEGYDNASIEYIFMARPTQSGILYHQMVGRGTRINLGKPYLMIVDFVDNTTSHTLQTSSSLLGLNEKINFQGEDIVLMKRDIDTLREKRPFYDFNNLDVKNIPYLLEEVKIIDEQELKRTSQDFQWHNFGNVLRIRNGIHYFTIEQSITGHYMVGNYTTIFEDRIKLQNFSSRMDAIRYVDVLISKNFMRGNTTTSAELWKNDFPTETQLFILRKYGIAENEILMMTRGEASALISKLKFRG